MIVRSRFRGKGRDDANQWWRFGIVVIIIMIASGVVVVIAIVTALEQDGLRDVVALVIKRGVAERDTRRRSLATSTTENVKIAAGLVKMLHCHLLPQKKTTCRASSSLLAPRRRLGRVPTTSRSIARPAVKASRRSNGPHDDRICCAYSDAIRGSCPKSMAHSNDRLTTKPCCVFRNYYPKETLLISGSSRSARAIRFTTCDSLPPAPPTLLDGL
jgi:hypothetical protein